MVFDMKVFMIFMNLFLVLILFASQMINVATTRKTLLFGIRVPEGTKKTKEAKKITSEFVILNIISLVIFTIVGVLIAYTNVKTMFIFLFVLIFSMMGVSLLIYVNAWKKAKSLKEQNGWTPEYAVSVDTSFDDTLKQSVRKSIWWYIASLVIMIAGFVVSVAYLPYAPEQLPTHWGPNGVPDVFSENSIQTLLPMAAIGAFIIILMYVSSILMVKSKLQKGGKFGALTAQQGIKYKKMMINYFGYTSLVMCITFVLILLMTVTIIPSPTNAAPMIIAVVVLLSALMIPMFWIMIRSGQSGENLEVDDDYLENTARSITTINDDKFWKLGLFYFNKNDPAVLVEPRFGSGTDFNYAKPIAWVVSIFAVLLIIGVIVTLSIIM